MSDEAIWQQLETAGAVFKQRWESEPGFKEAYNEDPVGTLQAVGIPDAAIPAALQETGYGEADVSGFLDGRLSTTTTLPLSVRTGILGAGIIPSLGGGLFDCNSTCGYTCKSSCSVTVARL